jgi:hypothetical protein
MIAAQFALPLSPPPRVSNKALIFWITVAAGVAALVALLYLLEGQMPSPTHVWKLGAIGAALKYLLSFVGVFVTYLFAKSFVHVSPTPQNSLGELKLYLICIGACAFLAYCLGADLGTHREDVDPVFGDGDTVVDYVPTKEQRSRYGLIVFLCLIIPAVYGIHGGIQEAREKSERVE